MLVDCVPESAAARDEWKSLLNAADGLRDWKPSSLLTWQQVCNIALGKTHPSGTISSMVASADAVDITLRSLYNLEMLNVDHALINDVCLLRKLLCVCLMHKSSIQFMLGEPLPHTR